MEDSLLIPLMERELKAQGRRSAELGQRGAGGVGVGVAREERMQGFVFFCYLFVLMRFSPVSSVCSELLFLSLIEQSH